MTIKAIIFDLGRVLVDFDHMITCRALSKYSPYSPEEIYEKIFKSGTEREYDRGLGFSKFFKKCKEAIGAKNLSLKKFRNIWGNIFSENQDAFDVMEMIKPDKDLFMLSNTNDAHWEYVRNLPMVRRFFSDKDKLLLSFVLGCRKPEEEIFLTAVQRADCEIGEILFLDDTEEFVRVFRELGGNAEIYNCSKDKKEKLVSIFNKYDLLK